MILIVNQKQTHRSSFTSRSVRGTSSRPTCLCTTICGRLLLPQAPSQRQTPRRQSPLRFGSLQFANGMVPESPIGTTGSLPRIGSTGITCKRNGSRVTNRNHRLRQLAQNRLHGDNVKHLLVSLVLIHNMESAVQKPVCDRQN
jgi:hypothetical protein